MKTLLTSVLAIATFAIMMTSIPSAFGQSNPNVHAVDPVPAFGAPNTLFRMQSIAAQDPDVPNTTVDIYISRAFVLYDPDVGSSIPNTPEGPNSCDTYTPVAGDRMWALRNTDTQAQIEASHDAILTAGSSIFFDTTAIAGNGFGNGAVAAAPSVIGTATFYNLNVDPTKNNWVEINSAGNPTGSFDSTAQPGQYIFATCGFVDVNGNGAWGGASGAGAEPISVETRGFLIFQTVGGESMPISATSLLVAGASANSLWILPILGLAGTVIAIRKLEA